MANRYLIRSSNVSPNNNVNIRNRILITIEDGDVFLSHSGGKERINNEVNFNIADYYTKTEIISMLNSMLIGDGVDLFEYEKVSDNNTKLGLKVDKSDFNELLNRINNLASMDYVDEQIEQIEFDIDLSDYVTNEELQIAIANAQLGGEKVVVYTPTNTLPPNIYAKNVATNGIGSVESASIAVSTADLVSILDMKHVINKAGRISTVFKISDVAIESLSGKAYYVLSSSRLSNLNGVSWQELGNVDSEIITNGSDKYFKIFGGLDLIDVMDKYLYVKFEGIANTTQITWSNTTSDDVYFSLDINATNMFNSTGGKLYFNGFTIPKLPNVTINNLSNYGNSNDVLDIRCKITFEKDGIELVKNIGYNSETSSIDLGNITSKSDVYLLNAQWEIEYVDGTFYHLLRKTYKEIAYLQRVAPKQLNISVNKQISIAGVMGMVIHNGYIYGSCRYSNQNHFVKINTTNSNDITYLRVSIPNGDEVSNITNIVQEGEYLYAISAPYNLNQYLIRIKISDMTYNTYKIDNRSDGSIFALKNGNLYVTNTITTKYVYKYALSSLPSGTTGTTLTLPSPTASLNISNHVDMTIGLIAYPCVVDDTHLYIAYNDDEKSNYPLVKIRTSDLSFVGSTKIPKTGDDAMMDDKYIYYGQSASNGNNGYKYGTFAVRKSDLKLFVLGHLSMNDMSGDIKRSAYSYGSYLMGGNLLDSKDNNRIYNINKTQVESWTDDKIGAFTLDEYYYSSTYGIINEFMYDVPNSCFHGFTWVVDNQGYLSAGYVKFTMPNMSIIDKPIISGVTYVKNEYEFTLNSNIISDNGAPLTEASFEIYDKDGAIVENINILDYTIGSKSTTYTFNPMLNSKFYNNAKVAFVAKNAVGTSRSDLKLVDTTSKPILGTMSQMRSDNIIDFTLSSIFDGGLPLSSLKLELLEDDIVKVDMIISDKTNGQKTTTYEIEKTYVARYSATNSLGTVYSNEIDVDFYNIYIGGVVYYGDDVMSGVTVHLVDTTSNTIVKTTTTSESGEYIFDNLVSSRQYLLCGYYGTKRIVSKVLIPIKE